MIIKGTVALVTGGANGMGRMMVETLLEEGAKLVSIVDYDDEAGSILAAELQAKYAQERVQFFKCDVASKDQLRDAFNATQKVHNRLDIVCNNAGIEDQDDLDKLMQVNLIAPIIGTDLAKAFMMSQTEPAGGVIVNTASIGGLFPAVNLPYYGATKHGVVGYTNSVANQPSVKAANIRLNSICPAFVETGMYVRMSQGSVPIREATKKSKAVPMSDVRKAFLLAIEDDTLTGRSIRVTAGLGVDLHPVEDISKLQLFNS